MQVLGRHPRRDAKPRPRLGRCAVRNTLIQNMNRSALFSLGICAQCCQLVARVFVRGGLPLQSRSASQHAWRLHPPGHKLSSVKLICQVGVRARAGRGRAHAVLCCRAVNVASCCLSRLICTFGSLGERNTGARRCGSLHAPNGSHGPNPPRHCAQDEAYTAGGLGLAEKSNEIRHSKC